MPAALDTREAKRQLHELRTEEWSDLALGGLAIVAALVATQAAPSLALPLFIGGVVVVIRAGRAFFRRWDLCERLLLDPDAYEIPEINARAVHLARLESRAILARSIRSMLAAAPPYRRSRVELVADELAALAEELDDETLVLEPICAVRCQRLLTDGAESPLLNSLVPADGLRIAIKGIRAGFEQL
jgi:hypothetical protein